MSVGAFSFQQVLHILLAKAVGQSTQGLNVSPPSRPGSLPQGIRARFIQLPDNKKPPIPQGTGGF
ncbi:hypothetical protein EKG40_28400 [Pseudomonas moorei]|nr:hypothetical protein EKG40_28400 [Pseudomonas moorei]